jgi:hypothetical protein
MLNKNPDERPNISQVKQHRWLSEQPPIRETLTQSLEITPLPDCDCEETPNKGYVVISKHAPKETDESEVKQRQTTLITELAEKTARLSDAKFQETTSRLRGETEALMREVARIEEELGVGRGLIDNLTSSLSKKLADSQQLAGVERELLDKIAVVNAELERIYRPDTTAQISGEIRQLQQSTLEAQATFVRKQALHAGKHQEYKRRSEQVRSLEHESSVLASQLLAIKNELMQSGNEPKVTELHLQADIMRTRLTNFERISRPLSTSDATAAESIIESMSIRVKPIKGLEDVEMMERIEALEGSAMMMENKISQTSFEYEEEKSRILSVFRAKKEQTLAAAATARLTNEAAKNRIASEEKAAIQRQITALQEAPKVNLNDLHTLRKQAEEREQIAQAEADKICELLRRRETLHAETERQQKAIEETEIELGLLKGQVYAMGLVDL